MSRGARQVDPGMGGCRSCETALVPVDRNFVESQAQAGDVRFGRVAGLLRRLSTYLSGAQLGITVTSLAIGLVAEPSVATLLRGPLGRAVCLTAPRRWPRLCWRC